VGLKSRRKGKSGELEAGRVLADSVPGLHAHRSRQSDGETDHDLVVRFGHTHGPPSGLGVESKRIGRIVAMDYMRQAAEDCAASGDLPLVLMREDGHTRWAAMVWVDDLVRLSEIVQDAQVRLIGETEKDDE
jgi:hypothetical protein